jgi:hypothetical protein
LIAGSRSPPDRDSANVLVIREKGQNKHWAARATPRWQAAISRTIPVDSACGSKHGVDLDGCAVGLRQGRRQTALFGCPAVDGLFEDVGTATGLRAVDVLALPDGEHPSRVALPVAPALTDDRSGQP